MFSRNMVTLKQLLKEAVDKGASDLHLVTGMPPTLRINGEIAVTAYPVFAGDAIKKIIYEVLNNLQIKAFEENWELDLSANIEEIARVRMNVYIAKGMVEAAMRIIPAKITPLEDLGLPLSAVELTKKNNGLVLITGPAGMGKTTTLAAMIDYINRIDRKCRIVTIEDPIEYVHSHLKSVVIQREVGEDTRSFNEALKHALRQDPNIICVGEMRDLETIAIALTAAETGHLVLATLHTLDAMQTVNRIVDSFPAHQQPQIKVQLSFVLQGVISQRLLPRADGKGRALAVEVLVVNQAVRNLIRDGRVNQMESVMTTSAAAGMITMDKCLKDLYTAHVITYDVAMAHMKNPTNFKNL